MWLEGAQSTTTYMHKKKKKRRNMHRKGDKKLDGTRKTQIDPLCTPPHHIAAPYIATLQGRTNATRKIDPRLQ